MKKYYTLLFNTIIINLIALYIVSPSNCYSKELNIQTKHTIRSALNPRTLFKYRFASIAELLRHRFRNQNQVSAVDLDTGNGNFVVEFDKLLRAISNDVDIFGVEWMRMKYERAHRNLRQAGYTIKIGHAQDNVSESPDNYLNIGLADGSRDVVTINNIVNAYAIVPQATRIVNPHGLIFITVAEADVVEGYDAAIIRYLENNGMEVKRFDTLPLDYPRTNEYFQEGVLLIAWRKEHPIDFSFSQTGHNPDRNKSPEAISI